MMKIYLSVTSLFILLLVSNASGFEFLPSVQVFSERGPKAIHRYSIRNTQNQKVAIEIKAYSRIIDRAGNETKNPSSDFTIYPSQILLRPGEKRMVSVAYKGPQDASIEKAYRIVAEQLSIDTEGNVRKVGETETQIKFLYKYETSAYVRRKDVQNRKIDYDIADMSSSGKRAFKITLNNKSPQHIILKDWKVEFPSGISLSSVDGKELPVINILANSSRDIQVAWPAGLNSLDGAQIKLGK